MIPNDFPSHEAYLKYVKGCEEAWLSVQDGRPSDWSSWEEAWTFFDLSMGNGLNRLRVEGAYHMANNTVSPMFTLKHEECTRYCGECYPASNTYYWEAKKEGWRVYEMGYEVSFDYSVTASRSHP